MAIRGKAKAAHKKVALMVDGKRSKRGKKRPKKGATGKY